MQLYLSGWISSIPAQQLTISIQRVQSLGLGIMWPYVCKFLDFFPWAMFLSKRDTFIIFFDFFFSSACGGESDLYPARHQPYQSNMFGLWCVSKTRSLPFMGYKVCIKPYFFEPVFKNWKKRSCTLQLWERVFSICSHPQKICEITVLDFFCFTLNKDLPSF